MTHVTPLPPLHALVAFEALVRHGAPPPALAELGVSRAALANSIALLEERTGLRLLVRQTPTVELTASGLAYYHAVAEFARGAADALHKLGRSETEIRISASPGVSRLWLAPNLARIRESCPNIAFSVSATETLSDLERNQSDIAIRYCHREDHDPDGVTLWGEQLAIVAPANRAPSLALASVSELLSGNPLLEHPAFPWNWLLERHGPVRQMRAPDLVCHDMYALLMACARGEGLALLPLRVSRDLRRRLDLVPVNDIRIPGKSYVLLLSSSGRNREVVRHCVTVLASLAANGESASAG